MNICAIISEFNPFHNGHKYLIEKARENGATHIVAVMSGNFVQRGDCAIMSKFERAGAAVLNGIDLVLELPLTYSLSSAEKFSEGALNVISSLNCVNSICFGAENDNLASLKKIAEFLLSDEYKILLKSELSNGISFPSARENAISSKLGKTSAEIIKSPNNILATEYLKGIIKNGYNLTPLAVLRSGSSHDSLNCYSEQASATLIRELIKSGKIDEAQKFVPASAFDIYIKSISEKKSPYDLKFAETAILSKLRTMSETDFALLPDVSEGLESRIKSAVMTSLSLNELYDNIKTKRYTHSRIRRIILSAYLGIIKSDYCESINCTRALGFNSKGAEIMNISKKSGGVPVYTSLMDIKSKDFESMKLAEITSQATDLYSLMKEKPDPCGTDFTTKPFILR